MVGSAIVCEARLAGGRIAGTLAFSHRAKKLLASSSLPPSWLRSSLHTPRNATPPRSLPRAKEKRSWTRAPAVEDNCPHLLYRLMCGASPGVGHALSEASDFFAIAMDGDFLWSLRKNGRVGVAPDGPRRTPECEHVPRREKHRTSSIAAIHPPCTTMCLEPARQMSIEAMLKTTSHMTWKASAAIQPLEGMTPT